MRPLLIALLLLPLLSRGQDTTDVFVQNEKHVYTRTEVREQADSTLHFYLGYLFEHCTYRKKGYYSYTDSGKSVVHWSMLSKHKKIKGKLMNVFMSYQLDYTYPLCSAYNHIKGIIFLKLDSDLHARQDPDLKFIPYFVWTKEDCRLIGKEQAIELAINFGFKEGDKPPKATIQYDAPVKQFYWDISNRIQKDSIIQKHFVTQTMQINAYTKKKVSYTKTEKPENKQY